MNCEEVKILRDLARKYLECANHLHNREAIKLHTAVNDNNMIRPVVLINELPWSEMNIDDQLTLRCTDPYLRNIECFMRETIYQFKYLRADMIVTPYIPIQKVIHSTGIGVCVDEETIQYAEGNDIVSHKYNDQFSSIEDLDKLHNSIITYDEEQTNERMNLVGNILGDILPVKKVGKDHVFMSPWDTISTFRGVDNLIMDLILNPKLSHALVKKLTEINMDIDDQYLKLGLFNTTPNLLHCTSILNSTLHPEQDNKDYKNIWGRGTAQIFSTVSKDMHEEFDIEYMKKAIGRCGLVYYGCCEPLDKKIDIVEKIPNIRKISITPWANVDDAAEIISGRYVIASKPNPANVIGVLDEDNLKKEVKRIFDACKRNNCSFDFVLKDISTVSNNPKNIFKWEKIVMDMARNY